MLIDRYLVRLIALPFAATLGIFLSLLLLIRMSELVQYVLNEGGSPATLLQLVVLLVPQYLALALPVGFLAGVTLAFRSLTVAGEWDALLAAGVSTARLLRAPLAAGAVLGLLVCLVTGFLQPICLYSYEKLRFDIEHGGDGVSVAAGEFRRLTDDIVVRAAEARRDGTDLRDVFLSMREPGGSVVIAAERALLEPGRVTFSNGRIIRLGEQPDSAAFETYQVPIRIPAPPAFRARGGHERELLLTELLLTETSDNSGSVDGKARDAGLARRMAQCAVMLVLPFLGIALGRPPRRKKGGEGLFVALTLFLVYNELSLFAERMGFSGQAPPHATQVAFLAVSAAACLALFARTVGVVGPRWRRPAPGING